EIYALSLHDALPILKITGYVMKTAPLAIFAALAATIATQGLGVLATYAKFVGGFYLSLGLLWGVLIAACVLIVGRRALQLMASRSEEHTSELQSREK